MIYDIIIIGGGIVGLATAYQLKVKKPELKVLLLEKENTLAYHQTSHNSGVIHSGIYYKPGSLKAKNCTEGYHMLLDFCQQQKIPYDLCGKVIVATSQDELPALKKIHERGIANGLQDLKELNQDQLKEHEPHVNGIAGLYVPQTGIISYKKVSAKYAELFRSQDGKIALGQKVIDIQKAKESSHTTVITKSKRFEGKLVVNCAGLFSDKIASLTNKKIDTKIIPFRGEYYKLKPEKEYLVKTLIYPVPDPNFPFLGVHFTHMIEGGVEAGPNAVFATKREGYKKTDFSLVDTIEAFAWPGFRKVIYKYWRTGLGEYYRSYSKKAFTKALQKLIPEIKEEDLITGGAGVRAQACDRTGGLIDDFKIIEGPGIINVLNAPSPAATSSLSIGNTVSDMAIKKL